MAAIAYASRAGFVHAARAALPLTLALALLPIAHGAAHADDAPLPQAQPAPGTAPSAAAPPAAPDADARARAAAHWKRGAEHASQQAYAQALAEFEAAYALVRHAATLYNIALAQVGLGRTAAAVATLRAYLADPAATQNPTQRKAAQSLLERQLQKLAALAHAASPAGPAATAQLTVVVFPYGAVWIDGEPAGSSPLSRTLPVGPHTISGGRDAPELRTEVVLEPGEAQRVVLPWARADLVSALRPAPATPAAPTP